MSRDWRLVIAFSPPPRYFGFTPSASGKTWWRHITDLSRAQAVASQLVAMGIHGIIKKTAEPPRKKKPFVPRDHSNPHASRRDGGFGGRLNAAPDTFTWRIRKRKT